MTIHIGFRPTEFKTNMSIIRPALGTAADPIEASVVVATIPNCCVILKSTPWNCARKITATAWYKDVPSIFTVAPIGNTKSLTFLGTFKPSWTHLMVTGKVAALELVEKPKTELDSFYYKILYNQI